MNSLRRNAEFDDSMYGGLYFRTYDDATRGNINVGVFPENATEAEKKLISAYNTLIKTNRIKKPETRNKYLDNISKILYKNRLSENKRLEEKNLDDKYRVRAVFTPEDRKFGLQKYYRDYVKAQEGDDDDDEEQKLLSLPWHGKEFGEIIKPQRKLPNGEIILDPITNEPITLPWYGREFGEPYKQPIIYESRQSPEFYIPLDNIKENTEGIFEYIIENSLIGNNAGIETLKDIISWNPEMGMADYVALFTTFFSNYVGNETNRKRKLPNQSFLKGSRLKKIYSRLKPRLTIYIKELRKLDKKRLRALQPKVIKAPKAPKTPKAPKKIRVPIPTLDYSGLEGIKKCEKKMDDLKNQMKIMKRIMGAGMY